jgi:RNA ligase
MTSLAFEEYPKIPRLKREVVITEKIDGTNAQIAWLELDSEMGYAEALDNPHCLALLPGKVDGESARALFVGSRNRWLTLDKDNFGFARWVYDNAEELHSLGTGRHYGEWYGNGIQRDYGLWEKRFALFNTARWNDQNPNRPAICQVVPILARGEAVNDDDVMQLLHDKGSVLVPGYGRPEGIVVWHSASRQLYKRTFEQDGGKWGTT